MQLAIIGYGKMGKLIEERALEKAYKITAIIDPCAEQSLRGNQIYKSLDSLAQLPAKPDIAIEFTHPDAAFDNLLFLARAKIPAVTGTTGWFDKLPEIKKEVEANNTSLFWAPNFSLGMNLFYRIVEYTSGIFDPFNEYDVGGFEVHHNKKADSPSGTAKEIAQRALSKMKRKKKAVYEMLDHPPAADELHFASLRAGSVPGTHSLLFDSPADSIEITHTLRNREGLVAGALRAAQWLFEQKKSGVFTMDDMLSDILQRS